MVFARDFRFWVALLAAIPVWLLLWLCWQPTLAPGWPMAQPLGFLLPALAYPVLEELVFRGGMQPALALTLRQRWAWLSAANLLTSLLFASLHGFLHASPWALAVFLPSLVFGYFRERHDGLAAPIALHVFYNAGFVWLFGG